MELHIHGKNLELDETTRDYVTRKVNRLGRHLPSITTATIELARENTRAREERFVAQATLDIDGTALRGEERGATALAAVDSVIHVVNRRIQRYKGKLYKSEQVRKAGKNVSIRDAEVSSVPTLDGTTDDELHEALGRVVRLKRYPIKPITLDEAALQMELLGHDFFLFLESQTESYNLLYRRRDGDYGLIQPEPL